MIDDLVNELKVIKDKRIILCCDAAELVYDACGFKNVLIAPTVLKLQNAVGVGIYAEKSLKENLFSDPGDLCPAYIKLPQAERELRAKQGKDASI